MSLRRSWPLLLALTGCATSLVGAGPADVSVRGIEIDLEILPDLGVVREEVGVTVDGAGASLIDLRLSDRFRVERVTSSVGIVDHRHAGGRLRVVVDPPLDGPRTLRFRISGRPRRGEDDRIRGDRASIVPGDGWYPSPPDGSLFETRIRVVAPDGWTVAAPGEGRRAPDGAWTFEPGRPVRNVAVVAAPGLTTSTSVRSGIPVRIVGPTDAFDAAATATAFQDPLSWFAGAIAPYPFDGLTFAVVPGLPGPVEASGFVAVGPDDVPSDRAAAAVRIAGQWYGQWLDSDGPWIGAFGAWHAWTYALDRSIPPAEELQRLRREYLDLRGSRDVALLRAGPDAPDAVIRGKGSAAPEILRMTAGPRRFARMLDSMFAIAPARIRATGLEQIVRAEAGPEAVEVFEQWFGRTGVPRLRFTLRVMPSGDSGFRADVRVEQLRGSYRLPVEVVLVGRFDERRETLTVTEPRTDVYYLLPFRPERLVIDPLDRLFQEQPEVVVP